jgi:histidine triad (HIT) family protein
VKGEIPCYKIYEDEKAIAFLDVSPLSKGHTLVIPKNHSENILDITEEDLCHIMKVIKRISANIMNTYSPEGIVIRQNNGKKAGQSVFHTHFHIKPVFNGTTVVSEIDHRKEISEEEMKVICEELRMLN